VLAELTDEAARGGDVDRYGAGGLVEEVEEQVRALLGAPAALLLPSGTMAQQIALRFHADTRGRRTVAMHPTSHLVLHEEGALAALHGITAALVGDRMSLVTPKDLLAVPSAAAVLVELPQRETGGQLMAYGDLARLAQQAHAAGSALHVDGARRWECGPAFGCPLADVVGLADSTYVSLYKGLAGPAGAVLVGSPELVEQARIWRRRHGGTLPYLWPLALGARRGLREHLPRMPEYVAHAQALAAAIGAVADIVVPPVTPLFHVLLPGEPEVVEDVMLDVSESSGVFLGGADPGPRPGVSRREIYAGAAALEVTPQEAADLFAQVVARL
jgi:threonine aldolase